MVTRVLLADPNPLVRSLLDVALSRSMIDVVGATGTISELLELAAKEWPDVIVTELHLEDGDVDAHVVDLTGVGARVVILTDDCRPERVTALLSRGISGYLLRDIDAQAFVDAVRHVVGGHVVLHPAAATSVIEDWRKLRSSGRRTPSDRVLLTPRELDVLMALADGLSTKAIAHRLGVAVKTVDNHKTRVFDKLGVASRADAVAAALLQGVLGSDGNRWSPTPAVSTISPATGC